MKYLITLTFLALLTFKSNAQNSSENKKTEKQIIFFEGSLNEALALAKKKKKLVFMDTYTTWCGPCKMLKSKTFHDASVADFYNENFINIAIDAEKGDGPEIAKKYGVRGFPSLFYLNAAGEVVQLEMGFREPAAFVDLGKKAIEKKSEKKSEKKGNKK